MNDVLNSGFDSDSDAQAARRSDLCEAIDRKDISWIKQTLDTLHPADAADLMESLPSQSFKAVITLLGNALTGAILIKLQNEYRKDAIALSNDAVIRQAIDTLDSDDAIAILEYLDEDRRARILTGIKPENKAVLEASFVFREDTAGRLMQRNFLSAPEFWTVGQTIDFARENADGLSSNFYEVYIVDPTNSPLGYVLLSQLLRSERSVKLVNIMQTLSSDIDVDMDQEDVAYQLQKYSLASAPVKDRQGRLVGMITVDDMVHVIQQENTEDLLALSNVSSSGKSAHTILKSVRARAPWLAVNLVTAFIASIIIALFESSLERWVQLAILMPVVSALAGNAGSQGLAVAVRAIAEHEMEGPANRRAIIREILTGIVNGLIFALGVGLITLLWFHNIRLSGAIALAMLASLIWASASGIIVPLTLRRFGADPAVASSVFVLTLTDIMAFYSFLGIATIMLM